MILNAHTRERAELLELSQRWLQDYPDLNRAAEAESRRLLHDYHLPWRDVHQVYWHRFDNAQSSSRAFTGWAHSGPPTRTLTLPELVLRRFDPSAQDAADQLDQLSGVYSVDASHPAFDERNELRVLPSQLLKDFWQSDFASRYRARLTDFWRTRGMDFIALSRASALVSLAHARDSGYLSRADVAIVRSALANRQGTDLSIEGLGRTRVPPADVQLSTLTIEGIRARQVLHIRGPGGEHYLHLPGVAAGIRRFADETALAGWLAKEAASAAGLARLQALFDPADSSARVALARLGEGRLAPGWMGGEPLPADIDPFAWLAAQAADEMQRHADLALTSNSRLRKEAAIGFLSTLSQLAVDIAPAGWPVALVAIASATVALGLDVEKAVHARDSAERSDAIAAAIGQGLTALFTLPFVFGAEVADWPWEVQPQEPARLELPSLPASPVAARPLNSLGMIEQTDMDLLFAVQQGGRNHPATQVLEHGLAPTTRFARLPAMIEGPAVRVFGNAEGALAYAQANLDGPFHLLRIQARGLRVASLRVNLRLNRANTLALLGQPDQPLSGEQLQQLADGAWVEHEAHVAAAELAPARLRLLSAVDPQPWHPPALRVLRGVRHQQLSNLTAPGYVIEAQDSLRLVRFDPFSDSWRTAQGSAFRYNSQRGTFEPFAAAQAPEALAPAIEAATAELGLPATYPWAIAPLPTEGRLPLPRVIHSVWLGRRMPGRLVDNLIRNAREAGAGQAPFEYHLYLDVNDPLDHSLTLADLALGPANLRVHELSRTDFFQAFRQTPWYKHYLAATEGSGINYASAADVLRYRLLHYYGGLYMDVDDVIYAGTPSQGRFAGHDWTVAPGRLLLNGLVSEPRLGLHCGFNTSNFASLAGNPLLDAISRESYARFLANQDLYHERPYEGADPYETVTRYAQRINQVTGPGVFNEVLMEEQADVRQFRSLCRILNELYVPARHLAELHRQVRLRTPQYCPLAWRIRIGATASWLHTR